MVDWFFSVLVKYFIGFFPILTSFLDCVIIVLLNAFSKMFLPARVSHIDHKLSVIVKNKFSVDLRYGIVQRCSPIPCIRGLHPETCCNCFKAWHSSPYDGIITGPFPRKMQSVLICCKEIWRNFKRRIFRAVPNLLVLMHWSIAIVENFLYIYARE